MKENKPLESPVKQGSAVPVQDKGVGSAIPQTSRPERDCLLLLGKPKHSLKNGVILPGWSLLDMAMIGGSIRRIKIYGGNQRRWACKSSLHDGMANKINPFEIGQNINDILSFYNCWF